MADKEKDVPLDKAKAAGGVYLSEDGKSYHDAQGNPVTEDGEPVETETEAEVVEETDDWKDEMAKLKEESAGEAAPRTRRRRGSK